MCRKALLSLFLYCVCVFTLSAEIIEIDKIEEILPYVDQDTLVVLDIDDTLMVTAQMLGGDCWFRHFLKEQVSKGFSFEEALAKVLPDYMLFQHRTKVLPAENQTAAIVHQLQRKAKVIGLTTRSTELVYRTVQQLKTLDIDLNKNPLINKELQVSTDFSLFYVEGILCTQVRHKGDALKKLCDHLAYLPKKVIFVNDKLKYVEQLEETFAPLGIPYIGFRYGGCDEQCMVYNPQVAKVQHHYFNNILSNEDAAVILNAQNKINMRAYD